MLSFALRRFALALALVVLLPAWGGAVQVIAPNGGEVWTAGEIRTIRWSPTGSGTVRIELGSSPYGVPPEQNLNPAFHVISDNAPNTGSFEWTLPNLPGPALYVQVTDLDSGERDRSTAVFVLNHLPRALSYGAIYPSADANSRVGELTSPPFQALDFYILVEVNFVSVTNPSANGIGAWEATVLVPSQLTVIQRSLIPSNGHDFGSGEDNWIVGTGGVCVGVEPSAVVHYQALLLGLYTDLLVGIGPSTPSSFNDGSPGWTNGGCEDVGSIWPFRETHELVINPASVPTPVASWGQLKATY